MRSSGFKPQYSYTRPGRIDDAASLPNVLGRRQALIVLSKD